MTAKNALGSMSLIAFLPGLGLAVLGAMGGLSGAAGLLMVTYWIAAVVGGVMCLLPLLIFSGIWPKSGGRAKAKAPAKAVADKPAKAAAVTDEPVSGELDEVDEFSEASDDFESVESDDLEFSEFDEDEDKK